MSETDHYSAARDHVAGVAAYLDLSPEQAETLSWKLEAVMTVNPVSGTLAFLDGSHDVAGWLRNIERSNPALLGKGKPSETAAVMTTTDAASIMSAIRSGAMTEDQGLVALRSMSAPAAPTPATAAASPQKPQTISELMAATKRGVPGAETALEAAMRRAMR